MKVQVTKPKVRTYKLGVDIHPRVGGVRHVEGVVQGATLDEALDAADEQGVIDTEQIGKEFDGSDVRKVVMTIEVLP